MKKSASIAAVVLGSVLIAVTPVTAGDLQEDFSTNPFATGWRTCGDQSLFHWNQADGTLEVIWDSSRTNSFFLKPLGTVLGRDDDFAFSFDLRIDEIGIGKNQKDFAFPIVIGFLNSTQAPGTNFLRGTGVDSPNLVEFDYFRDSGYGATVWPLFVSTNSQFLFNGPDDYTVAEMTPGAWFHVSMQFTAASQTLATTMTRNGEPFGPIHDVRLGSSFSDFRVDAISVTSFSDFGDDWSSVLARGVVDNLAVTTPGPPVRDLVSGFAGAGWEVEFTSRVGWVYVLERTVDWSNWNPVTTARNGTGEKVLMRDASPDPESAFYRVQARKP